jgi:hypothetical protein
VSEFGHLLRIASVHGRLTSAVNTAGKQAYCHVCNVLTPCFGILTARHTAHDEEKAAINEAEQDISVRTPHWKANE